MIAKDPGSAMALPLHVRNQCYCKLVQWRHGDSWQRNGMNEMNTNSELLLSLSIEELEALADSKLALVAQARLDNLLARRKEKPLSAEDEHELDALLQKADQLTILKTRARYTLSQAKAEAAGT